MTTPQGRKLAIMRIAQSHDLHSLKAVWDTLGKGYQADPLVRQVKDDFKAVYEIAEKAKEAKE